MPVQPSSARLIAAVLLLSSVALVAAAPAHPSGHTGPSSINQRIFTQAPATATAPAGQVLADGRRLSDYVAATAWLRSLPTDSATLATAAQPHQEPASARPTSARRQNQAWDPVVGSRHGSVRRLTVETATLGVGSISKAYSVPAVGGVLPFTVATHGLRIAATSNDEFRLYTTTETQAARALVGDSFTYYVPLSSPSNAKSFSYAGPGAAGLMYFILIPASGATTVAVTVSFADEALDVQLASTCIDFSVTATPHNVQVAIFNATEFAKLVAFQAAQSTPLAAEYECPVGLSCSKTGVNVPASSYLVVLNLYAYSGVSVSVDVTDCDTTEVALVSDRKSQQGQINSSGPKSFTVSLDSSKQRGYICIACPASTTLEGHVTNDFLTSLNTNRGDSVTESLAYDEDGTWVVDCVDYGKAGRNSITVAFSTTSPTNVEYEVFIDVYFNQLPTTGSARIAGFATTFDERNYVITGTDAVGKSLDVTESEASVTVTINKEEPAFLIADIEGGSCLTYEPAAGQAYSGDVYWGIKPRHASTFSATYGPDGCPGLLGAISHPAVIAGIITGVVVCCCIAICCGVMAYRQNAKDAAFSRRMASAHPAVPMVAPVAKPVASPDAVVARTNPVAMHSINVTVSNTTTAAPPCPPRPPGF